jgi:hypothetical protein
MQIVASKEHASCQPNVVQSLVGKVSGLQINKSQNDKLTPQIDCS